MRIGEFDINRADGKILLNDIRLDTGILPRGHKLSKEDILYLKMTGVRKITAGEMGVADLSAENALSNLAPRIAGKNVVYVTPERNLCKIAADRDGIFICQENRLLKFNRMSSKVVLNTIAPYQNVRKGEVIAVLSVCPPALEEELLDEEERLEAFLAEEEVRVFIVTLPTVPSCASPLRFWKALTASSVS